MASSATAAHGNGSRATPPTPAQGPHNADASSPRLVPLTAQPPGASSSSPTKSSASSRKLKTASASSPPHLTESASQATPAPARLATVHHDDDDKDGLPRVAGPNAPPSSLPKSRVVRSGTGALSRRVPFASPSLREASPRPRADRRTVLAPCLVPFRPFPLVPCARDRIGLPPPPVGLPRNRAAGDRRVWDRTPQAPEPPRMGRSMRTIRTEMCNRARRRLGARRILFRRVTPVTGRGRSVSPPP